MTTKEQTTFIVQAMVCMDRIMKVVVVVAKMTAAKTRMVAAKNDKVCKNKQKKNDGVRKNKTKKIDANSKNKMN
jgi:hypothetical protein